MDLIRKLLEANDLVDDEHIPELDHNALDEVSSRATASGSNKTRLVMLINHGSLSDYLKPHGFDKFLDEFDNNDIFNSIATGNSPIKFIFRLRISLW